MRRMPLGVSSKRPSRWSMSPASASCLASLDRRSSESGGVVTEVAAHLVEIDLGERGRRVGRAQEVLELVEVAQPAGGIGSLAHAHGLVATETEALLPTGPGERPLEVAGQPVDLPAEVEVLEQRLGQTLELGALLG